MGTWIRTLKIDIITLFISLTIITFACVITYSYFKNYSAILNYSKGMMERNSTAIIDRINHVQAEAEEFLQDTSGLFIYSQNLSVDNHQLQMFMLNVLKVNPDVSSFFLAFSSGNRLLVKKIDSSSQTHFITEPNKPLPAGTVYVIKVIEISKRPFPEVWYYVDSKFQILGQENFKDLTLVVKDRPWYLGAIQTKQIYWTDPYFFIHTHDLGITVSYPMYDPQNNLKAILGADISFIELSNFLKKQNIGGFGRSFITKSNGELLVPEVQSTNKEKISLPVVTAAFDYFKKTGQHNFSFKFNNTRYLSYVSNLPSVFTKNWLIITIVPFSDFFAELIETQIEVILITLLILLFSILIIIYFSKRISKPIVKLAKEIDKITNLQLSSEERVHSYIVEIITIDYSIANMRATIRSFIRYVPKEIVKQLLSQGKEIALQVEKKTLTIFFSDVQDFTTIAETHSLNVLMPLLNEYFDGLSKIILKNQGTIDKYIGDSIMAFWGAPLPNLKHAFFACQAALQCQAFLSEFNHKRRLEGSPEFITRFGISMGPVVVGNIGTQERMNYTVIGDAVNTASRLQVTDKIYHVSIIISHDVYNQVKGQFLVRPLDTVEVRGKKTKIKVYELVAMLTADPKIGATPQQLELCETFTQAYQKFVEDDYATAQQLFEAIHQKFPNDYPTIFYLNRLKEMPN